MNKNEELRPESSTDIKDEKFGCNKVEGGPSVYLYDYYKTEKMTALQLFVSLKKENTSNLTESDVKKILVSVGDLDKELKYTVDLMSQALKRISEQSNPEKVKVERQCLNFCGEVYARCMLEEFNLKVEPDNATRMQFGKAVEKIVPELMSDKPRLRIVNLIKLGAMQCKLQDGYELAKLLALKINHAGLEGPGESTSDKVGQWGQLYRPSASSKLFREAIDLAQFVDQQNKEFRVSLNEAKKSLRHERGSLASSQRHLSESKKEVEAKEKEITELNDTVAERDREITELQQALENKRGVSKHEKNEIGAKSRIFLESNLGGLIEDALEFAELDPPRKSVIVDRLETAKYEIRVHIEWLKSLG